MIAGPDLERGIRQAMGREGVLSISELARVSHVRRDTLYGWFRKDTVHVSDGSVEKLASALGSKPGDPWYDAPSEVTLDPEAVALIEAAVDRAIERMENRLFAYFEDSQRQEEAEARVASRERPPRAEPTDEAPAARRPPPSTAGSSGR